MTLVGADPELLLFDDSGPVAAEGIIPGTKDRPHALERGVSVHPDNVCLEFNMPPCHNRGEFVRTVVDAMQQCDSILPEGIRMECAPAVEFKKEVLENSGAEAMLFRCREDEFVWKDYGIFDQSYEECVLWRVAGGHVHIGLSEDPPHYQKVNTAIACDYFIGLPMVLEEPLSGVIRRKYYGKAGAVRFKSYGVEYRTPSNIWLLDANSIGTMYDRVMQAVAYQMSIEDLLRAVPGVDVIKAIDTGDHPLARDCINRLKEVI